MLEDVIALLDALGVAGAGEDPLLPYLLGSVCQQVRNETNLPDVPKGLRHAVVELTAGEYLAFRKNTGQLDLDGLDLDAAVKQIQEGDTNVVFAVGDGTLTPEQRLDALISRLRRDRSPELIRYRRLLW